MLGNVFVLWKVAFFVDEEFPKGNSEVYKNATTFNLS
jgi:hypothetical protein